MYLCNTIFLHSEIPSRMRPVLSVKLRQVRDIVSAVVEEKKLPFITVKPWMYGH